MGLTEEQKQILQRLSPEERITLLVGRFNKTETKPTPPQRQRYDLGDTPALPESIDHLEPVRKALRRMAEFAERNGK